MELIKELKGGSLSKTLVYRKGGELIVRKKISSVVGREYGLVRWQSQIRKLQILYKYFPKNTVKVSSMGVDSDGYYYEIPYYENSLNCYDAVLKGNDLDPIIKEIVLLIKTMAGIKLESAVGAMSVYINEEILSPINNALGLTSNLDLSADEKQFFEGRLLKAQMKVEELILKYKDIRVDECLTHGNMTLENLLWDETSKKIIMIDPYAETYCETILGDVSQLLQSSKSGYEFISDNWSKEVMDIREYPESTLPENLKEFADLLASTLQDEGFYDLELVNILHASQFIRMFPFKIVNAKRQGVGFMLHGLDILEA